MVIAGNSSMRASASAFLQRIRLVASHGRRGATTADRSLACAGWITAAASPLATLSISTSQALACSCARELRRPLASVITMDAESTS